MLNELAVEIGTKLAQERLYISFCDRTWILDAGERESSAAELAPHPSSTG